MGEIKLRYPDNARQKDKNRLLFESLYKTISFHYCNDDIVEWDQNGDITFLLEPKRKLALFYNPVFYSGLSKNELSEAINLITSVWNIHQTNHIISLTKQH
jgi:hypothetical protein